MKPAAPDSEWRTAIIVGCGVGHARIDFTCKSNGTNLSHRAVLLDNLHTLVQTLPDEATIRADDTPWLLAGACFASRMALTSTARIIRRRRNAGGFLSAISRRFKGPIARPVWAIGPGRNGYPPALPNGYPHGYPPKNGGLRRGTATP
jgi:hypothetical protein